MPLPPESFVPMKLAEFRRGVQSLLAVEGADLLARIRHVFSHVLRVGVLGAGRIGSIFAFQLSSVGRHQVTVIARPGSVRLGQLQRDSGIVDVHGQRAEVRVLDALETETL
ncbi:MAG: 2-dehydropantoate 2-reductase N-terminal domain-containing protein [Janthinobacterium lividum]